MLADVRGMLGALDAGLAILRDERCDALACLGSTVEGGPDDEAVLARLRDAGAVVVASPHDAPGLLDGVPAQGEAAGVVLTHETPGGADDVLWINGCAAPSLLRASETLRETRGRACGDIYSPLVYVMGPLGVRRRLFLGPGRLVVDGASFLACPGSVALAGQSRYGGCVMTWDEAARELEAIPFDEHGRRLEHREPIVLVYCAELGDMRPDDDELKRVRFEVRASADGIVADVEELKPDVVVMDYHLAGGLSGVDAMLSLRHGGAMPVPVLTMAGNPSDSQAMKAAGAVGGLPFIYLKDVMTRMIREIGG